MPKFPSTNDPRPPKVTRKLLADLRSILREHVLGEQSPPLVFSVDSLKEELKKAGHAGIVGDQIGEGFKTLQRYGMIRLRLPLRMGGWTILWIDPNI
jgi:hypothetical protein